MRILSKQNSRLKMHYNERTQAVIQKLTSMFKEKFSSQDASILESLLKAYIRVISEEELHQRELLDLYGSIISFWKFIYKNPEGKALIRAYNPVYEQNGWVSRHTVIELSCQDSPFIVDTLMMLMSSMGLGIHFMMNIGGIDLKRDATGNLIALMDNVTDDKSVIDKDKTCLVIMEVDRQTDDKVALKAIEQKIAENYKKLQAVVRDFEPMKSELQTMIKEVHQPKDKVAQNYYEEAIDFLEFLKKDHFIFLGYCAFDAKTVKGEKVFVAEESSALGLFSVNDDYITALSDIYEKNLNINKNVDAILTVAKSDEISPIHRPAYMDIISVAIYNKKGEITGYKRLLGLYTSTAYHSSPQHIPFLRLRKEMVLKQSGFRKFGHAYKALSNIIDTYPRDELFLSSDEELFNTALGIYHIRERQVMKLFVRKDQFSRYYFCMLYMPRDRYNSEVRERVERILLKTLNGQRTTFKTNFLESVLCRIDFTVYLDGNEPVDQVDLELLEDKIKSVERQWSDYLFDDLIEEFGENKGRSYAQEYVHAFSSAYKDDYIPRKAVSDIVHFEQARKNRLAMSLYQVLEESGDRLHFKLFLKDQAVQLSQVMPILENFGLSVAEERPYKVKPKSGGFVWLSDFALLTSKPVEIAEVTDKLKEAFAVTWAGVAENDRFNSLIVYAGLDWREVAIVRAYTRYMTQIGVRFSQQYIEDTYIEYAEIVRLMVSLFDARFNPIYEAEEREAITKGVRKVLAAKLINVASLDQDKLLRRLQEAIEATQRTNFYQKDAHNQHKEYISFKLIPSKISEMPKPVPMFEIFMYSPRVEGVHLRGAKVARGGLRWSDRKEDYRTEVLGLVKAQQVKNAVIVPLGAKGGFLPKRLPILEGREAVMEEAISCYRMFISSLLDITDNIKNNEIIKPQNVVCYDEDDPYLVVAADKGTATFSDIANSVAMEYDFWLGDAFASGGSNGYDHKKMGITARGAWESVKRHFRERGKDTQTEDFTVVGIGDMAGDVFGNGMLLSKHIRLVGAFNHMHIFIDPNPDAAASYKERKRMFDLPRSSWEDYNQKLISQGGGIFSRQSKSIQLSPEMKALLKTDVNELEPNKLIQLLLKADYELLWNGGIGTYVKAHTESNEDVGDRANDSVRINGSDLNCLVVGEGGNLGCTQLGRIEYALKGGSINTDAIDNAAGVDCSDHEVNIKILLNMAIENGELSESSRNKLLAEMSDDVAHLVLQNNYGQNRTIANELQSQERYFVESYARLMRELERKMQLDREVEYLPTDKMLQSRALSGKSLTAPEFSVIMAYTKTMIKQQILKSDLPDDPHFNFFLLWEFPTVLREKYADLMQGHKLKREIIATQITNAVTLHMGVTFIQRLYDETGASVADIIKAFIAVVEIFSLDKLWQKVEKLSGQVSAESIQRCLQILFRFVRRNCRWILRNEPKGFPIAEVIAKYQHTAPSALKVFPRLLIPSEKQKIEDKAMALIDAGVPKTIVDQVLSFKMATSVMDLAHSIEVSKESKSFEKIAILLNQKLWLSWFRSCINHLGGKQSYWGTLSTSALRDDLDKMQYRLVRRVIEFTKDIDDVNDKVEHWLSTNSSYLARWNGLIEDMRTDEPNFESVNIAFRSLSDLARSH